MTTPDKSPVKCRSIAIFFLIQEKYFLDLLFGARFDDLIRFCKKYKISHLKLRSGNIKQKFSQEKFFSGNCSSGGDECWFENPNEIQSRKFQLFCLNYLSWVFLKEYFLGLLFWTSR